MKDPDFKMLIKASAWFVVLTAWLFYGLIIWVQFEHPHQEKDPVTSFQEGMRDARQHWQFSLVMLALIILYALCWGYIRGEKQHNNKKGKQNETRQQRRVGD